MGLGGNSSRVVLTEHSMSNQQILINSISGIHTKVTDQDHPVPKGLTTQHPTLVLLDMPPT